MMCAPAGGLWPLASFDSVAVITAAPWLSNTTNTAQPVLLKTHVDTALGAWAEDVYTGASVLSLVQQCTPRPGYPSQLWGTVYRRYPDGTCMAFPNASCAVLSNGYLSAQFLAVMDASPAEFVPVTPGQEYALTLANGTVTIKQDAATGAVASIVTTGWNAEAGTYGPALTVTYEQFVPRPSGGGDPSPFHPPWLSSCLPVP